MPLDLTSIKNAVTSLTSAINVSKRADKELRPVEDLNVIHLEE